MTASLARDGAAPSSGRVRGAAVRARGWGWRHAGRRSMAVSGLDLDIPPGQRVLLLGSSGAGKSTLLHAMAGVLGDSEDGDEYGALTVDGVSAASTRGTVGMVLQDPESQAVLARLGDDVAFGCENLGIPRAETWRRVHEALELVGLDVPLDSSTTALSGGQKQRLALAGVLAMRPGLVLLDEPTANLDPDGVVQVRDAVHHSVAATGATMIVVEHRVAVWKDVVDRVIVLDPAGGVLADGAPESVLRAQGASLARAGVWVPEHPPAFPVRDQTGRGQGAAELLTARGLAVARGRTRRSGKVVAAGIDVSVDEGRALAVTGPNGAGKSTLALTLAGLTAPAAGELSATPRLAAGAVREPHRWRSRQLLTRIGTVFQQPEHQFLAGTVHDELTIGPRAAGASRAEAAARADELLHRLHLDRLADANPFTLSGGQKRRLSVATTLATAPRVLVLDEPTFGQDARTWADLTRLLADLLDGGCGIVVVTHDGDLVEALADRRLHIDGAHTARTVAVGDRPGAR